jgi:mono/diheme cytochrome c family protein
MLVQNLKIFSVVIGTLALFTLVANSIPQLESDVPVELTFSADVTAEELVAAGEELYNGAGGCTACHGLGTRAPNLLADEAGTGTVGARCGNRVDGQDCQTYLYASMTDPNAFVVEGYLPIMQDMRRTISNNQIWAVIAYLQSVGGEVTVTGTDIASTVGAVAAAPAAAAAGGDDDPVGLLRQNTCLSCHMLEEEGVLLGPPFDGIGSRRDADYIRASILDPNSGADPEFEALIGVMPVNFGEMLSEEQLNTIVEYLAGLQ